MAINTVGYFVDKGAWKTKKKDLESSISGQGKQMHSEIVVYNALGNKSSAGPFLIVQDAFPCSVCDGKFIGQAKSVLFKITANNGNYSADHGLSMVLAATSFPYYIWYHGGVKTKGTNIAPAGFPVVPDFAAI